MIPIERMRSIREMANRLLAQKITFALCGSSVLHIWDIHTSRSKDIDFLCDRRPARGTEVPGSSFILPSIPLANGKDATKLLSEFLSHAIGHDGVPVLLLADQLAWMWLMRRKKDLQRLSSLRLAEVPPQARQYILAARIETGGTR